MKNVNMVKFSLLLCSMLFLSFGVSAQLSVCSNSNVVAQGCVGACGNPGTLTYDVTGPCASLNVPFCLSNIQTSLCPSHRAIARVYVNGQAVAGGNLTTLGSGISFSAPCGSQIDVVVYAIDVVPGIECVWLGELDFALSRL